jgi:hypothetical protein
LAPVLLAGCGSSSPSSSAAPPGLPSPPAVATVNQYVGTQASQSGEVNVSAGTEPQGGLYTVTVDDSKQTYSYFDIGAYSPGTGAEEYDLQSKALSGILGFIGITDQTSIFVEPTIGAPADMDAIVAKAKETATAAAKAW